MDLRSIEKDPVRLADWAELQILYSEESWFSLESIRTEADIEGLLTENDHNDMHSLPNEESELLVSQTVREIRRRAEYGGKGYPFRIHGERLELRPGAHRCTPYAFCLLVCDRDYWSDGDPSTWMFEQVASQALQSYLQGCSLLFGWPRKDLPQNIDSALDELARRTGDTRISVYPTKSTDKDLGLDVVGWKDFADSYTSKVLVYMQCATGEDWKGKRGDLDLSGGIWHQVISWTTPPVKALAIPYIVRPGDDWKRVTPGLLLMDRLRISSVLPARALSIQEIDDWFNYRLELVTKSRV